MLEIKNLSVEINNKTILNDLNLKVNEGEIHALMGPNGSGKSTLANVLMGNSAYEVKSGSIKFLNKDVLKMSPDERSKSGIFLAFQYPLEIPGVSFGSFLRMAVNAHRGEKEQLSVHRFRQLVREKAAMLKVDASFIDRNLNEGFSGGEKKKAEILQLALLNPKLAILDETDSGLDVDALKIVFNGLKKLKEDNPGMSIIIVTHYNRVLEYLTPDKVHVISKGKIVKEGGIELVKEIEKKGYVGMIGRGGKFSVNVKSFTEDQNDNM